MITLVDNQYVVTVNGCCLGQYSSYDEALTVYLELDPVALAF